MWPCPRTISKSATEWCTGDRGEGWGPTALPFSALWRETVEAWHCPNPQIQALGHLHPVSTHTQACRRQAHSLGPGVAWPSTPTGCPSGPSAQVRQVVPAPPDKRGVPDEVTPRERCAPPPAMCRKLWKASVFKRDKGQMCISNERKQRPQQVPERSGQGPSGGQCTGPQVPQAAPPTVPVRGGPQAFLHNFSKMYF